MSEIELKNLVIKTAETKEQPLAKMLLDASIKYNCHVSDLTICQQNCGDVIKFWVDRKPENIVDERSVHIQQLQTHLNLAVEALEQIAATEKLTWAELEKRSYNWDIAQTALNKIKGAK